MNKDLVLLIVGKYFKKNIQKQINLSFFFVWICLQYFGEKKKKKKYKRLVKVRLNLKEFSRNVLRGSELTEVSDKERNIHILSL
jgi:hypothetical protein